MPTYAYTCTECGHAFDIHQSFSDATLTECPNCGGKLRKVFSPVGVVFKGSGFYRNDARSGTKKTSTGSSSTSTTGSSTSSTTTSGTSTPAAKPASSGTSTSSTSSAAKPAAG